MGAAVQRGCIRASHPAALGSNPSSLFPFTTEFVNSIEIEPTLY